MATFSMRHQQSPHFVTGIATNMAVAGPSNDNMVQLIFYRDAVRLAEENYSGDEIKDADGKVVGMDLTLDKDGQKFEPYREDIAQIAIPAALCEEIGKILVNFATRPGMPKAAK